MRKKERKNEDKEIKKKEKEFNNLKFFYSFLFLILCPMSHVGMMAWMDGWINNNLTLSYFKNVGMMEI